MPGSTVSLESLSSPSPSPPPPEDQQDPEQRSNAGLDSGSELSELTEEEQDNDGANEDDSSRSAARKKKQRDRVVPPPMWDWALKKKPDKKDRPDWRSKFEEEEEEEEQAGPAEAMEEEEDDDPARDLGSDPVLTPDHEEAEAALSDNGVDDNDNDNDNDNEELPEDEGESADEAPPPMDGDVPNGDVSGDEVDDLENENADLDPDTLDVQQSPKPVVSPDLTDDEVDHENVGEDVGEDEIEDDDIPDTGEATKEGSEVDEEEEEIPPDDAEIPADDEPPTTEAVTPAEGVVDAVYAELDDAIMDVDVVQPALMSPVAVAASSIMAGASLLQPPSPSSSQPSTPSASRHSSRYPSAEPEPEQVPSEPEVEPEPERKPSGRAARTRKGKGRTRAARRSRAAAAAEAGDVDLDAQHAELPEGEGVDGEDLDVATPELDLDADMQPAHRAEALDVLAGIELKFALLRERLYVEKMDSLAWEEGLIADGTHPELLHLQAELSSRRDKRLELAARRRDYEAANVAKRRRLDESGAWSTWSNDRDQLQSQMVAETNGKKRKLERERRTLERPQPVRRFPLPLHDVPPAPSLRDIVKSSPFGLPESTSSLVKRASRKKESPGPQIPLAYPTLAPLSRGEIMHDFDLFASHRHLPVGYDPHRGMPGLMNAVLGGVPHGMDPYAMGLPVMDGLNRFGPPIQHQHMQGFAPPSRLPHQHSAPPGAPPHISHLQLQMEQEMQMRQASGVSHPHMQQFGGGPVNGPGIQMRRSISPIPLNGAGLGPLIPTTIGGGPVPPGLSNAKANGWTGPGKDPKRLNGENEGRDRERMADVLSQRDKERIERERALRDLDREREQEAERAYRMSYTPSRHSAHQHSHPHVHSNAQGLAAHHHGPHNHQHQHHHHHVHHHHHGPTHQGFSGPSGGHAPPMAGLPPNVGAGPAVQTLSPRGGREFEQRRPRSGAAAELIELSAPPQKHSVNSPPMSTFWKTEPLPSGPHPPSDRDRERERERERERAPAGPLGPPPPDVHDRLMTPFALGPSQIQRDPSSTGSPRKLHGPAGASNPSPSMPSSRRGSWSADDHPRPSSAALGPASGSQRLGGPPLPQASSTTSFHGSFGSPPNSNGRAIPHPLSPSAFTGPLRSPVRASQPGRMPLGGPLSPPPGVPPSPRRAGSPGVKHPRASSPGVYKPLPKLGGFPMPEDGNYVLPNGTLHLSSSSSGPPTLPPPPTALPPPRISNVALVEKVVGHPSSKVVPVDGS